MECGSLYVFSGGLKVTPNVLPASCRQTVACRIVPFCRQDAGYVFSVFAGRANGARTLVRSKIGRRSSLEISKRGSALPAFLRDKSRAPGEFLVGALNRYPRGAGVGQIFLSVVCALSFSISALAAEIEEQRTIHK